MRHLPLHGLAVAVFASDHFASALSRHRPREGAAETAERRTGPGGARLRLVASAVVLLGALALTARSVLAFRCIRVDRAEFPVEAVEHLRRSGAEGNLAVFFNWWEYAIWHLWPAVRVSMDGRRETVYPDSIYREQLNFVWGLEDWDATTGASGKARSRP